MTEGGVAWIDRALAAQTKAKSEDRFASMEEEGWEG
jgi:nitrogen fixation protein NifX